MPRKRVKQRKIDKKLIIDAFAEMAKQKNIDSANYMEWNLILIL